MPAARHARAVPNEGGHAEPGTAAASGATCARRCRARGPWTASTHRSVGGVGPTHGGHHPVGVRGIGHDVEGLVGHPPDDDVVDHRAVGVIEEVGVLGPAHVHLAQVVRQGLLEPIEGLGPTTRTVPRWLTSKTTASRPAGQVLGHRAGRIGERHLPPAEAGQFGSEAAVGVDQSGVAESRSSRWRSGVHRRPSRDRTPARDYRPGLAQAVRAMSGRRPVPARPYLAKRARVSRW